MFWRGLQHEFVEALDDQGTGEPGPEPDGSGDGNIIDLQSRGFGVRVVS